MPQAVVTASNADKWDLFGWDVALDGSGNLLAVGAPYEASNAVGVDTAARWRSELLTSAALHGK